MRTAMRYRILQRCFVHPATAAAGEAWQCIAYNISATGIGVVLPVQLQERTVLSIQAWGLPQGRPLQVRIVHTKPAEFLWYTGCAFLKRLSDADLTAWRSGPLDWLDAHPA
jgi:hypothetical protein